MLTQLYPRIFKFWILHIAMAILGIVTISISGPIQSVFSPKLSSQVSLMVGVLVAIFYYIVFARASRKMLCSLKEGLLFGVTGALPLVLIVLGAMVYLQKVPYNTIGYNYILLPVMLPFLGWIEQAYPLLPYHILSLSVPAVFMGAIIAGSLMSAPKRVDGAKV